MNRSIEDLFHKDTVAFFKDKKEGPFYLYSEKQIRKNIQNLMAAATRYFPGFRLQYAIKANGNPHILNIIKEEGVAADCSSPIELLIAKRMGFDLRRSTYTGNFESQADFREVLEHDCILNLDDGHRLEEICKIKTPTEVSFRINPGIGRGAHEKIVTGGEKAKFGLPHEETGELYKKALELGVKRFGIHMMTGSNVLDAEYFAQITAKLFDIIEEHIKPLGIELDFINIGGGLGVAYRDEEEELDLEKTFSMVADVFRERLDSLGVGKPDLAMEPGRYLVANAGVILSHITHVKNSYRKFIGLEAGMSSILRPAMYDAYHKVEVFNEATTEEDYYVCGQICESSDVFPELRRLKTAKAGDLVAIHTAGAYGHVMSSNYNHRLRPAEYLECEDGSLKQIREADRLQDFYRSITDFEF